VELDPGLNLVWVRGSVDNDRVDLGPGDDAVCGELVGRIFVCSEVVDPHRYLPYVGPSDQPGASAGRAVAEGDHRVLVASGAFLGVTAETIGQALARCSRAQPEPLGEAVIQAN
jgi:hypothetical protein